MPMERALRTLRLKTKRWESNRADVQRLRKLLTEVSHRTPGERRDELELGAAYALAEARSREMLAARACASATAYYLHRLDQTGGTP